MSGVPIVDDKGVLVGDVTARDLRDLIQDPVKFNSISKPLQMTRAPSFLTCSPLESYETVLKRVRQGKAHVVYVIAGGKLSNVITLRDLIRVCVKETADNSVRGLFEV